MSLSGASRSPLDAVAWAIRLARPMPPPPPDALDWERVWHIALREKLAMLGWLRGGDVIRKHAAPGVVARWRGHALAADARRADQLALLRDALAGLHDARCEALVLKGPALAVRAYGNAAARVSSDIDLLLRLDHRTQAQPALTALGWRRRSGSAPLDETLEIQRQGCTYFLELHSGLLHDTLHHHELHASAVDVVHLEGLTVRTLGGPELPVYLAAHAATHETPALLWFADLDAVWHSMTHRERHEAHQVARRAGLHGHLDWALAQVAALTAAGDGSLDAIRALGFADDGERRDHAFVRALRLAPSLVAAVRAAGAWLWPRHVRTSASATLALAGARIARLIRSPVPSTRPARAELATAPAALVSGRTLELGREELLGLVGEVVPAGARLWVKVHGASMAPAIPAGADVRLGPVRERSLRKGDVVLARLPSGLPVLHRVTAVRTHDVVLQGDALASADPPVSRDAILARAEAVRVGAVERPIPRRGARPWRRIGSAWMRRLAPGDAGGSRTRG